MSAILETGIDYSRLSDVKYMRTYLMQLNDDIRYMLTNLDPDDNFSEEGKKVYYRTDEALLNIEHDSAAFKIELEESDADLTAKLEQKENEIDLLVVKGDVTNQINLSTDTIRIQASRLHVYTENFYMDDSVLRVRGTIIAQAGAFGGFTIQRDAQNRPYLRGASGSVISSGTVSGAKGFFGSLSCTQNAQMDGSTWYLYNCRIQSAGLSFEDGFVCHDIDIAIWNEDRDEYTVWYPLTAGIEVDSDDIHVGRNFDDSGTVRCLAVYSFFEGEEKPPEDEDDYSDERLKRDLDPVAPEEAAAFLSDLRPIHYRLKADTEHQMGVIAQELIETEKKYRDYGITGTDPDGYYTVSYVRFIPLVAAALQEAEKELAKWR